MIISKTPLRISICGGGTDLKDYYAQQEGFVLNTAINKFVYVIIKERFDDFIYVNYSQKEIVKNLSELKHELVREAAIKCGLTNGFEVTMLSDIPSEGSGLGSSSSITVGLLNAFYQFTGKQVTLEQLAREACEIEIDILKKPIGKQDQYIAAFGGMKEITFKKDDTVEVKELGVNNEVKRKLISNLLLFYTNITRKADNVLNEQKKEIVNKIAYHNAIKELGYKAVEALQQNNIDAIGELLAQNWEMKKNLASSISNASIDEMYDLAIQGGASGGKIAGAGGGGFLLTYCTRAKQDQLRETMKDFKEMPFMFEPHGSRIILNYQS